MIGTFEFIVFMVVWSAGCWMQRSVFKIKHDLFIMLYGYIVGSISFIAMFAAESMK